LIYNLTGPVLVTGGAGFLGGSVIRHFSGAGYQVVGLGHGDRSRAAWADLGISSWRSSDVTFSTLVDLQIRPDVIVHCAGGSSVFRSINHADDDFIRTVGATREVLEYAHRYAPESHIVLPSSAAVYGEAARLPISEGSPLAPISPYGVHKRRSEDLCRDYARQKGLRISIVRLFSVYGPGLEKQLLWDACKKFSLQDTHFDGSGVEERDWLHVEDAAHLIAVAAARATSAVPIVNGGTGTATKVSDVLERVRKCWPSLLPKLSFSGCHREGDPSCYQADIQVARSWGWSPKYEIDFGIPQYVAWFHARGM
jgi:UDP-glucose 4-epimerase